MEFQFPFMKSMIWDLILGLNIYIYMLGFLETVSNKKISIFLLVDWYYQCSDN